MAKLLLGISVVFMLGSAVLGYLTKNKVSSIQQEKKSLSESIQGQEKAAKKARDEAKAAQEQLAAETAKLAAFETDLATAKSDAAAAKQTLATAQTEVDAKNKEIEELKVLIATPSGTQPVVDPNAAPGTIAVQQLAELNNKLAEAQQVIETQKAKVEEAQNRTQQLERAEQARKAKVLQKGLQGKVMAVNQAYNFVVLSLGDRQGVTAGAEMVVMRGQNMVGKVRISSVEPSSSIADIIPSSVAKGAFVQPGDTVVFRGS